MIDYGGVSEEYIGESVRERESERGDMKKS
jgi:hypothetical protein